MDTLYNAMSDEEIEGYEESVASEDEGGREAETTGSTPKDLGVQLSEMFLKEREVLSHLLTALEDFDFQLRWGIVRLFHLLLENAQKKVQDIVLTSPTAVSKIIDLLSDPREVIRNEAIILLIFLAHHNSSIQKILAFEGVFDKLLQIIESEGFSDGLIVVEDCVRLIHELLQDNVSNLNFFLEGGFTVHISKFFNFSCGQDITWGSQKVNNVIEMLKLVKVLAGPYNPQQTTSSFQKALFKHGVLNKIAVIVVSSGLPPKVLSESVVCVGNIIANNRTNQNFFENVMTLQSPPKPILLSLLISMVNEKQQLPLRTAVLYCFHSYLLGNSDKQADIVNTLLPSKVDVTNVTSGQLLCRGLFSRDSVSNWLCSVALSYALNDTLREKLLRVQLATSIGHAPVTLIQHAVSVLTNNDSSAQTKIGIMILLCNWLHNCPAAVTALLKISSTMSFFISQLCDASVYSKDGDNLSRGLAAFLLGICLVYNEDDKSVCEFDRKGILHIIEKRMGLEMYKKNICLVSMSESFNKNSQKVFMDIASSENLLLEFEIVGLFKTLESKILEALVGRTSENDQQIEKLRSEISGYKEALKKQDDAIKSKDDFTNELTQRLEALTNENEGLKYQINVISTATPVVQSSVPQLQQVTGVHGVSFYGNPNAAPVGYNTEYMNGYYPQVADMASGNHITNTPALSSCNELAKTSQVTEPSEQQIWESDVYKSLLEEKQKLTAQVSQLFDEMNKLDKRNLELTSQTTSLNEQIATLSVEGEKAKWYDMQYPVLQQQYEQIYNKFCDLQSSFTQHFDPEQKLQQLQNRLNECENANGQWAQENEYLKVQLSSEAQRANEIATNADALTAQVEDLHARISSLQAEKNSTENTPSEPCANGYKDYPIPNNQTSVGELSLNIEALQINTTDSSCTSAQLASELTKYKTQNESLMQELSDLKSEQDDLLVLLADQDSKLKVMKKKLKDFGESVGSDFSDYDINGSEEDGYNDEQFNGNLKNDKYSLHQTDSSSSSSEG